MEDTLRVKKSSGRRSKKVLILVLMEDTLREQYDFIDLAAQKGVLILVLMEDTLREQRLMFLCIRVFGVCSNF